MIPSGFDKKVSIDTLKEWTGGQKKDNVLDSYKNNNDEKQKRKRRISKSRTVGDKQMENIFDNVPNMTMDTSVLNVTESG